MASMLLAVAVLAFPKPIGSIPPPVAPFGTELLPTAGVTYPMVFPVLRNLSFRDGYNDHRGRYRHTGVDIAGPRMTPLLAPFAGRINMKKESIWIVADDGWRTLMTHFNDDTPGKRDNKGTVDHMFAPNLKPGQRVEAGQFIGYMGDSGWATGPHLHFEIHSPKGIRNPYWSLKRARRVSTPTYTLPAKQERPREGTERFEACPRGYDPASQVLKVILVARQSPDGKVKVVTSPTYAYVIVPEEEGVGSLLNELPHYETLSLYVRKMKGLWLAEEIVIRGEEKREEPYPDRVPPLSPS